MTVITLNLLLCMLPMPPLPARQLGCFRL